MFNLQSFKGQQEFFQLLSLTEYYKVAKLDLTVVIDDSQEILTGNFNYATSLYTRETIERLQQHYILILKELIKYPRMIQKYDHIEY